MEHGDLAQLGALLGAVGAPLVLVPRRRSALLLGFLLLGAAEAALGLALVPLEDVGALVARPLAVAALAVAALAVAALAGALARFPALVPLAVLGAAPFRLPVDLGDERAFLLLPLYGVLAAAVLAAAYQSLRGAELAAPSLVVALPAAAVISLAGVSLLWSRDIRAGSIALAFFFFPFAALVAVVARSPFAPALPRALAVLAVALASLFAAVGIWQAWTKELFFSPALEVANAYTSFFRVSSLFKDPNIYGRALVFAIAVLLVALWLDRIRLRVAVPLIAFLSLGLLLSYSQTSFVALFAVALAVPLALGDRRTRTVLGAAAVAFGLVGAVVTARAAAGESLRDVTSGRSRLVDLTATVIEEHPLTGVGIGGQPRASAEAAGRRSARGSASHTAPLTVAAELGVLGVAAYLAFLAGTAWLLVAVARVEQPLGLALAAVFLVLVVHSLFYSGFFEDPVTWCVLGIASAAVAARAAAAGGAAATRTSGVTALAPAKVASRGHSTAT